jgi:hypothetical protein
MSLTGVAVKNESKIMTKRMVCFIRVCAVVSVLAAGMANAQQSPDVSYVMIFAFRDAQQVQSTAQAVAWGAAAKASKEQLVATCRSTKEAVTRVGRPTLLEYIETREFGPDIKACLEKIAEFQSAALGEIDAVQAIVESGGGHDEVLAFVAAEKECSALKQEVARLISQLAETEPAQNAGRRSRQAVSGGGGGQAAQPVRGREAECPLGWDELLQLTGEEGPAAKYRRGPDGELQRAEAYYGGSVVVAVSKIDGGFRVTLGNDIAVADFTSRPWFTAAEREGLVDVYSQYVAKEPGSGEPKNVGRFIVQMEQDPQLPIRASFVLRGVE